MPKAIQADRELVKSLYVQGFNPAQIAQKTGLNPNTIGTWSRRGKWTVIRSKTAQALSGPTEQLASMTIASASERAKGKAASKLEGLLESLGQIPAGKSLGKLKGQAEVLESLTRAGKTVFNWGDESILGIVAVGTIEAAENAIDVEATATDAVCHTENTQITDAKPDEPKTD